MKSFRKKLTFSASARRTRVNITSQAEAALGERGIREIRLSERKFYQKVTDIYATAVDYDKTAKTTRDFFAKVQNNRRLVPIRPNRFVPRDSPLWRIETDLGRHPRGHSLQVNYDERNIPIQISVYLDQVYIYNIGELPAEMPLKRLFAKHSSMPRNPNIANAFFKTEMVECWGRGYEKIIEACKEYGDKLLKVKLEQGGVMVHVVERWA